MPLNYMRKKQRRNRRRKMSKNKPKITLCTIKNIDGVATIVPVKKEDSNEKESN